MEFARRGWAAAVVMRRGYGDSGGAYAESVGFCPNPDYLTSALASTADLRASISHLARRADIDSSRLLVVGQSTGGLATVALTVDPPRGMLAAINFAGGVRATKCKEKEDRLVAAVAALGKRSRIPMLWIYSENDTYFGPDLARQLKEVFSSGGGKVEFVPFAPFGTDGHQLFARGISQWTPYVDEFLKAQKLVTLEGPLPLPPPPDIAPPAQLSDNGLKSFEEFLRSAPHRAFAVSTMGAYGWQSARRTAGEASKLAIEACSKHSANCAIAVIDDAPLPLPPLPNPPPQLTDAGRKSFANFLKGPPHRAFAVSSKGAYAWYSGRRTMEEASKLAIERCMLQADDCSIVVIDDKAAP